MPVNKTRLTRKLQTLRAKDLNNIVAQQIYLPFIGTNYTKDQLISWLQDKIDLLVDARNATDAQIQNRVTNYYQSLGAADKLIADKIINNEIYALDGASNLGAFNKLVAIVLSKFITD